MCIQIYDYMIQFDYEVSCFFRSSDARSSNAEECNIITQLRYMWGRRLTVAGTQLFISRYLPLVTVCYAFYCASYYFDLYDQS